MYFQNSLYFATLDFSFFANAQKLLENTSVGPDESLSFSPIVAGASDYIIGRSTAASVNMVMMGHDE